MAAYFLMMDVGGTGIKTGIFNQEGELLGEIESFPARSRESKEIIFSNFASIIEQMGGKLPGKEDTFQGIGMAFPGPFDYEQGISLMKGLDKYDEIYGYRLPEEIQKRIKKKSLLSEDGCRFLFLHDVEAFALGESRFGSASDLNRLFCLCIGTGAGSAFVENGAAVKQGKGVPQNGWIYDTPFKDSIIDDYVSVRGLRKQAEGCFLKIPDGAGLYCLALDGDERAKEVFKSFGRDVLQAITPFLREFGPDALILGGQISKSFSFFGEDLECFCNEQGIRIVLTVDTSRRALEGLYVRLKEKQE